MTMLIAKRQVINCPDFSGTGGSGELEIFTKNTGDVPEVTLHGQKDNKFNLVGSCKLTDFVLATDSQGSFCILSLAATHTVVKPYQGSHSFLVKWWLSSQAFWDNLLCCLMGGSGQGNPQAL